jgi:TatA/E family protein of Tat protein translocase
MFGFGFGELLLIFLIVLLVFGPKRLPELAQALGRTLGELRRTVDDLKFDMYHPAEQFKKGILDISNAAAPRDVNLLSAPTPPKVLDITAQQKQTESKLSDDEYDEGSGI